MADYWKSQDRKYCEFCKCWITDNRPSRDFHEKGRRHQENVKKKLKYITKISTKNQKESDRNDISMKKMERAALEAYRKDIENNADLTSIAINERVKEENLVISGGSKKVWHELKSKEGHTYYWNTVTNETAWEAPAEGYLNAEDQQNESYLKGKKQLEEAEKERRKEGYVKAQQQKKENEEERARLAREKMKERRVKEETPPPVTTGPIIEPGNPDPYGGWQKVKETVHVDLQLPPKPEYFEASVEYKPEPVVKEFKEKKVESLHFVLGETFFKKRKTGFGNKKNARQRLDDD